MNCSTCGSTLPPNAKNCPVCGTRVQTASTTSEISSSDPTFVSSFPARESGDVPAIDRTVVAGPNDGIGKGGTGENPPYPYGNQPSSPGNNQSNPYTPIPNTSYSYAPPPPPPNSYNPYNPQPVGPQVSYTPPPTFAPQPGQQPGQRQPRRRRGLTLLLILLAVLLIGVSTFIYFSTVQQTNLAHAQATATARAQSNATATVVSGVATAHAQATATATANPYTSQGKLTLFDTLQDNKQGSSWDENGNCAFVDQSYHAIAPNPDFSDACNARRTNFSDFVFEVEMKVVQGDAGGIIFRSNDVQEGNHHYSFLISQDGGYLLSMISGTQPKTLTNGTSPAINQGLNQTNKIAVVANGTIIKLYVNGQQIGNYNDGTYKSGAIGVEVNPVSHKSEVAFSNIKVWSL